MKKMSSQVILLLTTRSARLISRLGVNSLSMSASGELEPGPRSFGVPMKQVADHRQAVRKMLDETQAMARAVGWGGFTSG
jgi:hypothetical protein